MFRRSNENSVSHEQILQNYEIKAERAPKLLAKLHRDLQKIYGPDKTVDGATFNTIVLMDDFSASGTSYLRVEGTKIEGKLQEFSRDVRDAKSALGSLVNSETRVILVLYIATEQAVSHLRQLLQKQWGENGIQFEIVVVHPLLPDIRILPGDSLEGLLNEYYSEDELEDEHTDKGEHGVKFGYAKCGLPVVLTHNTPNNSIYPLWAKSSKLRPLFPRISRHKKS